MDRKQRWEKIHEVRATGEGGAGREPAPSLALLHQTGVPLDAPILDVGGGASPLADALFAEGYRDVTVIDIAHSALTTPHRKPDGAKLTLIEGDVLENGELGKYAVWHDRAVLHFLNDDSERARYLERLRAHLLPGGHVILGCFSPEAPENCCGLAVRRYSVLQLAELLAPDFAPCAMIRVTHRTAAGKEQPFVYSRFKHQTEN